MMKPGAIAKGKKGRKKPGEKTYTEEEEGFFSALTIGS